MPRLLSHALVLALFIGNATSMAQADWGAFYLGSPSAEPRRQAAALSDRTGMHPTERAGTRPRLLPTANGTGRQVPRPFDSAALDTRARCVAEILRAQERYGIPDNILLGIGLQEAGVSRDGGLTVWPWAVNAAGKGRIFENQAAAMAWVGDRQAMGVQSIDVGCMQINLHWHPDAFTDLEQGFDPVVNVDYAARFLHNLHGETGDWMRAAGAFHSRTPDRAAVYLAALRRNVAVANDRIAAFRGMVGTETLEPMPGLVLRTAAPVSDGAQAAAPLPQTPWTHGHWSTGPQDAGGVYGIYSRDQLEPVLPQFLQDF